jgi:hypothetical protein
MNFSPVSFIGCGFLQFKDVWAKLLTQSGLTYMEESCLSIELWTWIAIFYTNLVAVSHRVDIEKRKLQEKKLFEKTITKFQFCEYVLRVGCRKVYFLFWHNFKNIVFLKKYILNYIVKVGNMIWMEFTNTLKHRNQIEFKQTQKLKHLKEFSINTFQLAPLCCFVPNSFFSAVLRTLFSKSLKDSEYFITYQLYFIPVGIGEHFFCYLFSTGLDYFSGFTVGEK